MTGTGRRATQDELWHLSQVEREHGTRVTAAHREKVGGDLWTPTSDEEAHARDLYRIGSRIVQIVRAVYPKWLSLAEIVVSLRALAVPFHDSITVQQAIWRYAMPEKFRVPPLPHRPALALEWRDHSMFVHWINSNSED